MMKNYRYLLLDLDNTLFDFDRAEETAFHAAFSASGLVSDSAVYEAYHEINDRLWKQLERGEMTRERLKNLRFEQLFALFGWEDNGRSQKISEDYFVLLSEQNFLLPGAEEVCRRLREKFALYIVTNGTYAVQIRRFSGSPLEPYITGMFVSEKLGSAKPSREYFEKVIRAVGDDELSHYCVIGDSLSSDIAGAAAIGIDAVWLDRSGNGDTRGLPDVHILEDIRQLPAFLLESDELQRKNGEK